MMDSARHFDTVVIGAGISGLACARRLFQHGRWRQAGRLCVLEARDRIGGRVESIDVKGCRLDTGANWIHGIGTTEEPNPLMGILPDKRVRKLSGSVIFRPSGSSESNKKRMSVPSTNEDEWVHVSTPIPPSTEPSMLTTDLVVPSEDAGKLSASMWSTIGALHELAHTRSAGECKRLPVLDVISNLSGFKDAFKSIKPEYHSVLRAMPQFVESMEAAPLDARSAEHSQDAIGMSLLEFKINDFDGEQVFLQDGYAAIAQEIGKDLLEAGKVQHGVHVERIDWTSDPISITTADGSITAREVICTIPLGVLKERSQSLFQPQLPDSYQEAISSLGFGTLDKIFLVYTHAWWTEEPFKSIMRKGISRSPVATEAESEEPDFFVGFTDALRGIEIHKDGSATTGLRMLSLTNLHSLTGFPVLGSFVSCANARHIESLSDKAAGELLHSELTTWFGREPPAPETVHVTRWATDPLSQGSYSHMITGISERKHREQFQNSLRGSTAGSLRFAGEHTSSDHFATVHGALLSGWDAADSIIAEHNTARH